MSINSNRKNLMNSLPRITREEAIELSRKGSLNSLSALMEYYTTTNDKNTRKYVRSALEKARNKKGTSIVIDRGYHVQNKSRLVDIIAGLFSNQYDDYLL